MEDRVELPLGELMMALREKTALRTRKRELVPRLAEMFRKAEGVSRVVEPREFAALGLPEPSAGGRMADLLLAGADGYAFSAANEGEPVIAVHEGGYPGHHGYLNSDPDMRATFLAWGSGILRGVRIGAVSSADVASTVAFLFGLKMENSEGRVLREIFVE